MKSCTRFQAERICCPPLLFKKLILGFQRLTVLPFSRRQELYAAGPSGYDRKKCKGARRKRLWTPRTFATIWRCIAPIKNRQADTKLLV